MNKSLLYELLQSQIQVSNDWRFFEKRGYYLNQNQPSTLLKKIELCTITRKNKPWVKLTKIFFSLFPKPPQFLYYNFSKSQTEKVLKSLPYEKSWIWLFKILSCTQNKHISLVNILKDCSSWKSRMNLVRHKIFIWQCFNFPHKLSKPLLGSFIFIFFLFSLSLGLNFYFSLKIAFPSRQTDQIYETWINWVLASQFYLFAGHEKH